MASAWDFGVAPVPFTADADLTAKQWLLVAPASTGGYIGAVTSACNPVPAGVLVNDPSAGQAAEVVIFGPVKAKCRVNSCYLKNGKFLKAASDGFLEPVETIGVDNPFARYFDARQTTADGSFLGNVVILGNVSACGATLGTS